MLQNWRFLIFEVITKSLEVILTRNAYALEKSGEKTVIQSNVEKCTTEVDDFIQFERKVKLLYNECLKE